MLTYWVVSTPKSGGSNGLHPHRRFTFPEQSSVPCIYNLAVVDKGKVSENDFVPSICLPRRALASSERGFKLLQQQQV
jgi:hypothetical protein